MFPPLTVFDLETTGLDARKGHKIIEIAAVRIENGILDTKNTFSRFIYPERELPWEIKQITKITEEELKGAPTIEQVLPEFLKFSEGSILVAHNAEFDMSFLNKEKEHCWGYVQLPECLCTMKLSKQVFPVEFRHNLDVVAIRLGLQIPTPRHRALPDALLTGQVLLKLSEKGGISSFEDLKKKAILEQVSV